MEGQFNKSINALVARASACTNALVNGFACVKETLLLVRALLSASFFLLVLFRNFMTRRRFHGTQMLFLSSLSLHKIYLDATELNIADLFTVALPVSNFATASSAHFQIYTLNGRYSTRFCLLSLVIFSRRRSYAASWPRFSALMPTNASI